MHKAYDIRKRKNVCVPSWLVKGIGWGDRGQGGGVKVFLVKFPALTYVIELNERNQLLFTELKSLLWCQDMLFGIPKK